LNALSKIVGVLCDVVVANLALINIRHVDKVEIGLPSASVVLDIVGKRGALNERVQVLMAGEDWVVCP
jgi:hypothetical protein